MADNIIYVSPAGSDTAAGDPAHPLRSPVKAAERATPGMVIQLEHGTYAPIILDGLRGTAEHPIVLRGKSPLPLDWTTVMEVDREMYAVPIRHALTAGHLSLAATNGLAVIEGYGSAVGLLVRNCEHLRIENLVVRDARTNIEFHGARQVTIQDCVATGDPAASISGVVLAINEDETEPNRFIRFERVLAYGVKETGFAVTRGAAYDVEWECCMAHGMMSNGGDGFSFQHVVPGKHDEPGVPHVSPEGVNYRMRLTRCVAMENRLDGFDIGKGVGGLTLQFCLGDRNAWAEYYAKDLKVWSSGNTFIRCRMTGRVQFISGTHTLEDFRSGTKFDSPENQEPPHAAGM